MADTGQEEKEALCPECGHGFKLFMDRILSDDRGGRRDPPIECPVCGCGECRLS